MSDTKEVEDAKRVLRAAYYSKVSAEVADLVRAYFDGEYDDEEGQRERLEQAVDSSVTYTSDNYLTVFASEKSDDGFDQMVELGGLGTGTRGNVPNGTEVIQRWAYSTFEIDAQELLQNQYGAAVKLLAEPMGEGLDSDQRLTWLAEHFGTLLFKEEGGIRHYYVGVVDAGTATEVDLGLVTVDSSGERGTHAREHAERRSVPEKFDLITGPERSARDPGTMAALRDALLDAGFFAERQPTRTPKPASPPKVSQISDELLEEVRQLGDLSEDEVSDTRLRNFLSQYDLEDGVEFLAEEAHFEFSRRSPHNRQARDR